MGDLLVHRDVPTEMRDGVRLFADVYRPAAPGQYPVLLQRTAYSKGGQNGSAMMNPIRAASEGFAVVVQDCRGRYSSEGDWTPFFSEIEDGYDTVEWCAAQGWSNGSVGMYGMSYVGATQWLAAISAPPHLRTVFPVMTAADYYDGWIYRGGAVNLAFTWAWTVQFLAAPHLARLGLPENDRAAEESRLLQAIERLRRTLSPWPLADEPLLGRQGLAPYWQEWLSHPARDAYWEHINILAHHDRITVPAFNFGGWYDLFVAGPPRNFSGLTQKAATAEARDGQRLLMGPWTHNAPTVTTVGERGFGFNAAVPLEEIQMRWFHHWLHEQDTGMLDEPPVRIYVMNDGWRDEQEWPLARTQYVDYFPRSGGRANSATGDGALSLDPPGAAEPPDVFLYNPLNPAPTVGGGGIYDQRRAAERTDVLVYATPPLTQAVEVSGEVRLALFASSSAPDTDFHAKLVDVSPDGYAANVTEGILRARYRPGNDGGALLTPDVPEELVIDMLVTSNVFRVGHQIRLEVTSSCFPRFDRNPNTGGDAAHTRETRPAVQHVFHDASRPSRLILPVIPRDRR